MASLGFVTRLILVWFGLVLISLVWMAFRVLPPRDGWWAVAMWMLATVFLGPIAVGAHYRTQKGGATGTLSEVVGASTFCVAAYSIAWVVSIALLIQAGDEPNPLTTLLALAFIPVSAGLLIVRAPLLQRLGVPYRRGLRRGLLGEVMNWSLGLAAFFSVSIYVDNRWFSTIPHPTSPYYWAMASLAALSGLVVLMVLHWLLHMRGFTIWAPLSARQSGENAGVRLPMLRDSWWLLLATVAVMVLGIALSASVFQ